MDELPLVCKFTYSYSYNGMLKEKISIFEQNGKLHGRHYDRWLKWNKDILGECKVPMDILPDMLLKNVKEQILIFDEVKKRSTETEIQVIAERN